eukprot:tig00020723_g13521.t1
MKGFALGLAVGAAITTPDEQSLRRYLAESAAQQAAAETGSRIVGTAVNWLSGALLPDAVIHIANYGVFVKATVVIPGGQVRQFIGAFGRWFPLP